MNTIISLTEKLSFPFLRISLGVVLVWIGALKFVDPTGVVGLLSASFSFLAFNAFVYLLGAVEVAAGIILFTGRGLKYVGLLCVGLFAGTITIFLIAPAVSYGEAGFPLLSLPGEFLLKDLVLMAASMVLVKVASTNLNVAAR